MPNLDIEARLLFKGVLYPEAQMGIRAFQQDLEKAALNVAPLLRLELLKHLQAVASKVAAKHSGPWPGGTTPTTLSRRSGAAMTSLMEGVSVSGTGASIEGTMSGAFYLSIHEYGGTIRATRAQFLTIPLPAALNSNGTPKYMAARQWNDTFVGRSKAGNLLIFQRRGREIVPLYVLKKEVKIKARLGLRKAQEGAMDLFVERVARAVTREIME